MSKNLWDKATRTIVKAGRIPIPITDNLIELLQNLMTEEQAKFILIFRKPSLNINQIKEKTDLDDESLDKMLNDLMDNGIVIGTKSRRTGIDVYRLMGPFPGIFEYTNLRGETDEKHKKLARLFEKMFYQMREQTQKNLDKLIPQFKNLPPTDRIVPVEDEIEGMPVDNIIPYEEVSKIVDNYDHIAVAHCYCRHQKDLLEDQCKITKEKKNCFLLGKSAQFAIKHKFGETISKEEAKKIISKSSEEGLVHKVFHIHLDPELEEEAICNCCKCCCGIFQMYYGGMMPYHCYSSYIAKIDKEICVGCGTCVEMCPMEAIELVDSIASINEEKCIGCGVCAYHCPEKSINLKRTGLREVFIPPPKIMNN